MFGLPFPTYLGWFLTPICTFGTAAYCIYRYKKFLKDGK